MSVRDRHDELVSLRGNHPAWRLLAADNAPMVLGFCERAFLGLNVRSIAHPEIVSAPCEVTEDAVPLTYTRRVSDHRAVGWQSQGGQLRLFVLVQDAGLIGKGDWLAAARAAIEDAEYVSFAAFSSAATVLGERLGPLVQGPASGAGLPRTSSSGTARSTPRPRPPSSPRRCQSSPFTSRRGALSIDRSPDRFGTEVSDLSGKVTT